MAQMDYDSEFDHTIDTFHYGLASSIYLDSIVVSAIGSGLNIGDFVEIVREDKSFNQAFYNLRFHEHTFDHRIYFFNNKRQIIASYTGLNKQNYIDKCRSKKCL